MKYTNLCKSDIKISTVGLGCMSLQKDDMSTSQSIVDKAIDSGINYFDTADLYDFGANEILLGKILKSKRKDIVIATKVGNQWRNDHSGWDWNVSKNYINKAIDESLSRLNTDYVDLYQIHGGTIDDNFEEVVSTLEILQKKGKIRAYGISSIRPNVFMKYAKYANISSNMMQYSLLDTRPEEYVEELLSNNVSILARGVFGQGILLGKLVKPYLTHAEKEVINIVETTKRIATQFNLSLEAFCISYLLNVQKATSAIVGVRTYDQMLKLSNAILQIENFPNDFFSLDIPKIKYKEHLL